jgi:hypothetical protein
VSARRAGQAPREFVKGASPNVAEAYEGAGLHAYYDSAGRLDLIEAFQPCSRVFAGIELLGDARGVVASPRELGLVGREDGEGGIWFEDQGFALYAPSEASEGVSVFGRGYDTGA